MLLGVANVVVALMIARNLHTLSRVTEKNQSTQSIYEQWMRKKELSIHVPEIAELDNQIYSPDVAYHYDSHQQRIYIVLIIDVLFNSFVAQWLVSPRSLPEDMKAHFGSLLRYDPELVERLMVERGYTGPGVVGEFYSEVQQLKADILKC